MPITKRDIERARDVLEEDAKNTFLNMSREDQLIVLLSMEGSNSNRLAKVEKWQIDFEQDARRYRLEREKRENPDEDDVMGTTQKILKAISEAEAKRFDFWLWFRDRILPGVVQLITLAILYLTFSGKVP